MNLIPESSKVSLSEWDLMTEEQRDSLREREEAAFLLAVEHYRVLVSRKPLLKAKLDRSGDAYLKALAGGHAALWSHRAF